MLGSGSEEAEEGGKEEDVVEVISSALDPAMEEVGSRSGLEPDGELDEPGANEEEEEAGG